MTRRRRSLAVLALLAAACGGGEELVVVPGGIAFTVTPVTITVVPGDTVRLRIADGQGNVVRGARFSASAGAATVDSSGLVTALAPGIGFVTISVTERGLTTTSSLPVTVLPVALFPSQATIAVGGTLTFTPRAEGDRPVSGPFAWTSSDTTIATVDADGRVRGVGPGIARIAATGRDGRVRAEATVTVQCACTPIQSLTVSPIQVTLQPGGTQQLTATVTLSPWSPTGWSRDVTYTSSDTTVATVSSTGLITGRRTGTAVVIVASVAAPAVTQAVAVTVRTGGS